MAGRYALKRLFDTWLMGTKFVTGTVTPIRRQFFGPDDRSKPLPDQTTPTIAHTCPRQGTARGAPEEAAIFDRDNPPPSGLPAGSKYDFPDLATRVEALNPRGMILSLHGVKARITHRSAAGFLGQKAADANRIIEFVVYRYATSLRIMRALEKNVIRFLCRF